MNVAKSQEFLVVTTTTSTQDEARRIAQHALGLRLAACVQIEGPIESHYCWQGEVQSNREWRLVIKTSTSAYCRLQEAIEQMHSYDQPQLIATPIYCGSEGYLQWLRESTEA